ncbi:hypothetical protein BDE36_0495 [Arcticibacter tournemirensis]|nr:hypothetical protein BDE36_0495 [Arcticibacter tournemirensis]
MMRKKTSVKVALSFCLLLYFSAITVSLDFFHDHKAEVACHDSGKHGVCTHKSHVSNTSSCWVCSAHLQKEATEPAISTELSLEVPFVRILTENKAIGYVCERLVLLLRGPPSK